MIKLYDMEKATSNLDCTITEAYYTDNIEVV